MSSADLHGAYLAKIASNSNVASGNTSKLQQASDNISHSEQVHPASENEALLCLFQWPAKPVFLGEQGKTYQRKNSRLVDQ